MGELQARLPAPNALSEREKEVLKLAALGYSNQKIAERLVVASSTVHWHMKNIYSKLDVHNRTQAVARARELAVLQE
jgi:LuxR family maltose regulon positive regulatory protein